MKPDNSIKHALITGASRGIGKAAAEVFARYGYDLTLTCHNSIRELKALADSLHATYGVSCLPLQADMGNEADVIGVFSSIHHLDVLVNNAGIAHLGLLTDMTALQLLHLPGRHPSYVEKAQRQYYQCLLCMGDTRRLHGSRLLCF